MDKRRKDVLEAPYFHVVFTVPQELNPLIYCNQQLLYDVLYHSVSATINELTEDTNHLGAQSVINYLGKYTHRIAISNHRIIRMDEDNVTYFVKDYREEGKWKECTISGIEFIRRFLMHVLPKRFVRIRHYGLLCTRTKTRHLTLCRNLLGCKQYLSKLKDMETPQILETLYGIKVTVCKCCGGHLGKPQQRTPLRI